MGNHQRSIAAPALAILLSLSICWTCVLHEMSPSVKYAQHCEFHAIGEVVCTSAGK